MREGVKWLPEKQLDVFFVTLNKAEKDYSPTTMYNDYSINESLFHWQSQSTTAADSPTGQRYIHHRERGSKVLLFVREYQGRPDHRRRGGLYLPGGGRLCEARGEQAHEYHLEAGTADSGEVFEENQ